MDEELGGVNPNSFFEQITEVRGVAETAQKTSNSNLSLLNELREKVEIISNDLRILKGETNAAKDKAFEEEDKKQKEEMQAKVEAQNEKTQGGSLGEGEQGESKPTGTKGGGGGVIGFFSALIGGLVGGVTGLAIQGVGRILDFGSKAINGAKKLGENLAKGFAGLFGKKKKKGKGEAKPAVSPDKLLNANFDEEEEKDSEKLTTVREKGKVVGGNVSQEKSDLMKRQIDLEEEMSDAIEQGDMKRYEKLEKESEEIDKKLFNLEKSPQSKKKKDKRGILGMIGGSIDAITGNLTDFDKRGGKTFGATRVATGMADFFTADMFDLDKRGKMDLFGMRKKMENKRKKEAYENNPNVKNFRNQTNKLKEQAEGFPVDTTVNPDGSITSKFSGIRVGGEPVVGDTLSLKQRMVIKSKIKMGNKIEGIEKELYEKSGGGNFSEAEKKEIKELYGPKEGEKDPFDYYGDNNSKDAFEFNQGGLVQGYNQGGEVDSVPAMLTPGEFVVTKDAVQKVGVDTLKGLNSSVGATNKPELSSLSIGFGGGDMSPFEKKQTSYQGMDLGFTSTSKKTVDGEVVEDITKKEYLTPTQTKQKLTEMGIPYKELLNGTVIPDAAKMGAEKMPEFYRIAKEAIMQQIPDDLPGIPAAVRAEYKKLQETALKELDKFMTQMAGGGDFTDTAQIEAEMNRYIPGTIENIGLQITESANKSKPKKKGLFSLGSQTQNFNEGGLVQPVIESKNEKGEMKRIDSISQSVDANRQTIQLIEEQNQAMSPPNQNPNPLAPADTPQTSPAEIKDTDAPIPFAMLLRQNAQRYLNLGNNAMVIS